jgi:hypothetical protein
MATVFGARLGDVKGSAEKVPRREVLIYTRSSGQRQTYSGSLVMLEEEAHDLMRLFAEHSATVSVE